MATAKIQTVKGLRVDFFAHFAKKFYSSLDGLDSRNGYRTGIVFSGEICYTWCNTLTDKLELEVANEHE